MQHCVVLADGGQHRKRHSRMLSPQSIDQRRQILAHVDRAAISAQRAAAAAPSLRVGIVDASYDSMPLILHEVQQQYPELEIHQIEAGVPEQFERLLNLARRVSIFAQLRCEPLYALCPRFHALGVLQPTSAYQSLASNHFTR